MKKFLFCIGLLCLLVACSSPGKISDDEQIKCLESFKNKLKSINAVYLAPWDFVQTRHSLVEKEVVDYQYAIKHKKEKLEIRYSITPYVKPVKETNKVIIGSENLYKAFTLTVLMNIVNGKKENIFSGEILDKTKAKSDFNADWVAIYVMKPESDFAKNYKYVHLLTLYKKNAGQVYIYYLFDDFKLAENQLMPMLKSVSFN